MRLEAPDVDHVDNVTLDAVRAGEIDAESLPHLDDCDQCGEELGWLGQLGGALSIHVAATAVQPEKDAAIRAAARAAGRRGSRRRLGVILPVVAAVAAAGLFLVLRAGGDSPAASSTAVSRQIERPLDVNGDGAVDILDAFSLARVIEIGADTRPAWDANGDRRVDQLDVDAIARKAVSLTAAEPPRDSSGTTGTGRL